MDDHALLREYLEHHSEKAFSELVVRHLPLVYGTALRLAGDSHTAQDVAQAVFIQLARKAWTIRDGHALPGWLYRATRHAACAALRGEIRRRARETAAMNLAEQNRPSASIAEQIAPLLDEALGCLSRVEQDALLLRYFQDKSFREVGAALGLNEDAARKRTDRALDKIRLHFSRHGITATAALLGPALTTHAAMRLPAGFAAKVAASSYAQAAGAAGFVQAVWAAYFMSTTSKVITTAVMVALIASIAVSVHHWKTSSLNEQPVPQANEVSISVGQHNLTMALSPPAKVQVAPPKLPPAPASNIPDAYGQSLEEKAVANNLRQLATAAEQYMLDKGVTQARYSDIVGTSEDDYVSSDPNRSEGHFTPVGDESYQDFVVYQTQTQVTERAPDGNIVTYNL
jgi:RNA polymerase sigma factor (sigma-70 family)